MKDKKAGGQRVILVRHGESEANVGIRTSNFSDIALTALGHAQAQAVAAASPKPDQIIVSPYLRARQTAEPLIQRCPLAQVFQEPVQEFSYLDATKVANTSSAERRPRAEAFWGRADPLYSDGGMAESFASLLKRVDLLLDKASLLPGSTVVFTHGMFMQAVIHHLLLGRRQPSPESMQSFSAFSRAVPVGNGFFLDLSFSQGLWMLGSLNGDHLR